MTQVLELLLIYDGSVAGEAVLRKADKIFLYLIADLGPVEKAVGGASVVILRDLVFKPQVELFLRKGAVTLEGHGIEGFVTFL